MNDRIVKISFNVWASDEKEGEELKAAVCGFIDWFGQHGIKVSAERLTTAINNWQKNAFVKNAIINHFKTN